MSIKKILLVLVFLLAIFTAVPASVAEARARVRGYYRKSGTYVMSYYRTSPNRIKYDNWSSYGNYNPYTGKSGYAKWWR